MESSKKILLSTIGIAVLIVVLTGVTFAFFNYTRTGSSNVIKVGRISFVSKDEQTITLSNLFPIDPTEQGIMDDNTKVGTYSITIEGDTDYSGGIEYLVSVVDSNITTLPINVDISVSNGLGTENANYFTARETKNANIYKKLVNNQIVGDGMLLVGYIKPNTTSGTAEGVDGSITIKAYLDENKILISDTYDGTESDNMGTPNSLAQGKTVLTTAEWNALQNSGLSFKVKVEANEGIWVNPSLEEIMKIENFDATKNRGILDNESSEFVSASTGIDFGAVSSSTNGRGVYMRAGTENSTYPILYYRGEVTDNNVIFNNKCWKAVRTTDTGGVKLVYSGLPNELYESKSLSETDYKKNIANTDSRWTFDSTDNTWNIEIDNNSQPAIEFTVPQGDNYKLVMTGTSGLSCGGKYTFYKNGSDVNSNMNGGGAAMDLTYEYGTLAATDVIMMNYTGSSSSSCVVTFKIKMLGKGEKIADNVCNNTVEDRHISLNVGGIPTNKFAFNTSSNSPAYVGYMYGIVYPYSTSNWTSDAKFGSNFTWDGTNYTLVDATETTPDATHHYSCNSIDADATCKDLRYVYYSNNNNATKYYITLTGGDGVEEALAKMNTNTNNSNVKTQIDAWYASNMNSVTSKLEDTVWCNDRSIGKYNGWSSTGNWETNWKDYSMLYGAFERSNLATNSSIEKNKPSLECANQNDRFTVNNAIGNRALDYPVAMLTEDELVLAGGLADSISRFYIYDGSKYYWSLSPSYFIATNAREFTGGENFSIFVDDKYGLRPAISIKPGLPIAKGSGTATNPYVIE